MGSKDKIAIMYQCYFPDLDDYIVKENVLACRKSTGKYSEVMESQVGNLLSEEKRSLNLW